MSGDEPSVSADLAAKLLRLSIRRLQQLVKDGWIRKNAAGKYSVAGCVHGYLDWRDDSDKRKAAAAVKSVVQTARAREIELRIAEREGELISFDDALAAIETLAGLVRTSLAGLPARLTRDRIERARFQKETDAILHDLADALEAQTAGLGPKAR